MSVDKSLKSADSLVRHRNVLTRAERIEKMKQDGRWTDDSTAIGMPKIGHRKVSVGKKAKDMKEEKTEGDESTTETPAT